MKSIIPKYSNKPLKKKEAIQVDLSDFEIPCINFDLSTYKSKIYTLESKEDGKKYLLKKPIQNKNESHEKYKSRSYNIALKEYLFANYYNAMIEQDNIPAAPKTYIATKDDVLCPLVEYYQSFFELGTSSFLNGYNKTYDVQDYSSEKLSEIEKFSEHLLHSLVIGRGDFHGKNILYSEINKMNYIISIDFDQAEVTGQGNFYKKLECSNDMFSFILLISRKYGFYNYIFNKNFAKDIREFVKKYDVEKAINSFKVSLCNLKKEDIISINIDDQLKLFKDNIIKRLAFLNDCSYLIEFELAIKDKNPSKILKYIANLSPFAVLGKNPKSSNKNIYLIDSKYDIDKVMESLVLNFEEICNNYGTDYLDSYEKGETLRSNKVLNKMLFQIAFSTMVLSGTLGFIFIIKPEIIFDKKILLASDLLSLAISSLYVITHSEEYGCYDNPSPIVKQAELEFSQRKVVNER